MPNVRDISVAHSDLYPSDQGELAHAMATTTATRSRPALPASVVR